MTSSIHLICSSRLLSFQMPINDELKEMFGLGFFFLARKLKSMKEEN